MVTFHQTYESTSNININDNTNDNTNTNTNTNTNNKVNRSIGGNDDMIKNESEATPLCNGDTEIKKRDERQLGKNKSRAGEPIIHRLYVVLSIFFSGICVGFSFGFYVSTKYWHSDVGKLRTAAMSRDVGDKELQQTPHQKLAVSDMITFGAFQQQQQQQQQKAPLMGFSLLNMNYDDNNRDPPPLVYLHHVEAYSLLLNDDNGGIGSLTSMLSRYSLPYFLISSGWDVQKNQAYCAVATAASILNSLRFLERDTSQSSSSQVTSNSLPTDPAYRPFAYATQNDLFNTCTNQNVIYTNDNGIMDGVLTPPFGLSMMQMADLFRNCYFRNGNSVYGNVDINVQHADHTHLTLAKMRFDLMNALEDKNSRVMINYNRHLVGQLGGGHWSPLAAYSQSMDAFLVMDVAKYKYPPVWIPTSLLYESMGTKDPCGNWDYPHAQTKLNQEERLSLTPQYYQQAMKKLNCKPAYRGYIILTFD
jgi:hypothetical protein